MRAEAIASRTSTQLRAAAYGAAGAALDAIHLVAAAAWTGGLAQVVRIVWQDRRAGRDVWVQPVRRYARPAL